MTTSPDERHLDADGLAEYLEAGVPALVSIAGTPALTLVIEPGEHRIALRAPYDGADLPELTHYRHLALSFGTTAGEDWVEFGVSGGADLVEAYPVLRSVADRVQLSGASVGSAVREVLQIHHQMLSSLGRLTEQQEIGLVGELLVLDHLIGTIGESAAIASWRGPLVEEHDFGLEDIDIEVKTTLSEERAHRISSLTQLVPNPDRALWLISVKLTLGGLAGRTLSQRVEATAESIVSTAVRELFVATLERIGWTGAQSNLYTRRFSVRGPVLAYRVGPEFPAVTPGRLSAGGVPLDRIRALSYILVLEGLSPDPPPPPILELGAI